MHSGPAPTPSAQRKRTISPERKLAWAAAPAAFSLLELLVVLVLVALVAVMVVMRWSGVQHKAVTEAAVDRLEFLDQHLRRYARTHRTECRLSFELEKSRVRKLYQTSDRKNPAWETLGRGISIAKLQTTGSRQQGQPIEITFNRDGTSPTYVVQLQGPEKQPLWLVFAGVTGQVTRFQSQREADAALEITKIAKRL